MDIWKRKATPIWMILPLTPEVETIPALQEITKEHTGPEPAGPAMVRYVCIRGICTDIRIGDRQKLLGGNLYHYCPTGANQFKRAGRWSWIPEPGAVIFTNGQRGLSHRDCDRGNIHPGQDYWRAIPQELPA